MEPGVADITHVPTGADQTGGEIELGDGQEARREEASDLEEGAATDHTGPLGEEHRRGPAPHPRVPAIQEPVEGVDHAVRLSLCHWLVNVAADNAQTRALLERRPQTLGGPR